MSQLMECGIQHLSLQKLRFRQGMDYITRFPVVLDSTLTGLLKCIRVGISSDEWFGARGELDLTEKTAFLLLLCSHGTIARLLLCLRILQFFSYTLRAT